MKPAEPRRTVWSGRYVAVHVEGRWEFVGRVRGIEAVAILAIDQGHVILVEQWRVPLGARCLELPAGLVGDDSAGEAIETAAARELEEETGYRAGKIETIGRFSSSPGMLSETFTLVRATKLEKVGAGGGDEAEAITVHHVALADIAAFVEAKRAEGCVIDVRMLALLGAGLV